MALPRGLSEESGLSMTLTMHISRCGHPLRELLLVTKKGVCRGAGVVVKNGKKSI